MASTFIESPLAVPVVQDHCELNSTSASMMFPLASVHALAQAMIPSSEKSDAGPNEIRFWLFRPNVVLVDVPR